MTTIPCRGPSDLLALLPYQLGYHPRDAVVVVGLEAGMLTFVERLDLPPEDHLLDAVRLLLPPLVRERPDGVLLVGYEDERGAGAALPLLGLLELECRVKGLEVLDSFVVRGGHWSSPRCGEDCCRDGGTPLPDASRTPGVAEFVALGVAPLPDRAAVERLVRVEPAAATRTERALREVAGTPSSGDGAAVGPEVVDAWARLTRLDPDAVAVTDLGDDEVAVILLSLDDVVWRDAVVARLCPGCLPAGRLPGRFVRLAEAAVPDRPWVGPGGEGADAVADPAGVGETHARVAATHRLRARLLAVARRAPDGVAAPFLTVVANLAWWTGDGTVARVALERALVCDPEHRLAQLLSQMVDLGVRPDPAG